MSFLKNIEGVPCELVKQGFRLQPDEKRWFDWQLNSEHDWAYWQFIKSPTGAKFCRPVIRKDGFDIYDPSGWEDGHIPSPEMLSVWSYWWLDDIPVHVMASSDLTISWQDPFTGVQKTDVRKEKRWHGPILPTYYK